MSHYQPDEYIEKWLKDAVPRISCPSPVFQQVLDNKPQCTEKQSQILIQTRAQLEEQGRQHYADNHQQDDHPDGIQSPSDYRKLTDKHVNHLSADSCGVTVPPTVSRTTQRDHSRALISHSPGVQGHVSSNLSHENEENYEILSKKYARRERHKVKADKYEMKRNRKTNLKLDLSKARRKRPKSTLKKHGTVLNKEFEAMNVVSGRLTIQRGTSRGLFCKGKTSATIENYDVPDLTVSEMNFLSQRQRRNIDNSQGPHRKPEQKTQQPAALENSEYFSQENNSHESTQSLRHLHGAQADPVALKASIYYQVGSPQSLRLRGSPISWSSSPERHLLIPNRTATLHLADGTRPRTMEQNINGLANIDMSPEEYTRKALISDQPGTWQLTKSIRDTDSVRSVSDLRKLARKLDSVERDELISHDESAVVMTSAIDKPGCPTYTTKVPEDCFRYHHTPSFPANKHLPFEPNRSSDGRSKLDMIVSHRILEAALKVGHQHDQVNQLQLQGNSIQLRSANLKASNKTTSRTIDSQYFPISGIGTQNTDCDISEKEYCIDKASTTLSNYAGFVASQVMSSEGNSHDRGSTCDFTVQDHGSMLLSDVNSRADSKPYRLKPTETHDDGFGVPTAANTKHILHSLVSQQINNFGVLSPSLLPVRQADTLGSGKGYDSLFQGISSASTHDDFLFMGYGTPNNLY